MDQVDLPVIEPTEKLERAIELMKAAGRSAVFVTLSKPCVVDVDMILHALRSRGNVNIGEVAPRQVTITVEEELSGMVSDGLSAVLGAGPLQGKVRKLMDSGGAIYALAGISGGRAVIVTRHEGFANMLNYATSVWRCRVDNNHVWPTSDLLQPGDKCPDDQSDTDLI